MWYVYDKKRKGQVISCFLETDKCVRIREAEKEEEDEEPKKK
jgi:hypothetical protein